MKKPTKDVAASVRARLLRLARERGEDFQLVLTRYANERLLFRLAASRHAPAFILKGAALFTLWTGSTHRTTRDLDLLGFGEPTDRHVREVFVEVLSLNVADDGVAFDLDTLVVAPIREDKEHGGIRLVVVARIKEARLRLQVDVGFGDAVTPEPEPMDFPPLLDFPAPRIRAYRRETVVAEKVEAIVQLGMANSRMKDFYDLVVLARDYEFEGITLSRAIRATFERRKTPLPEGLPTGLTPEFYDDSTKRMQWTGFIRKAGVNDVATLAESVTRIIVFIEAPLGAVRSGTLLTAQWQPGGPWTRTTN